MITNNGTQYSSSEFKQAVSTYGLVHTTISPHYPQSNGFIERFVQTIKNILQNVKKLGLSFT